MMSFNTMDEANEKEGMLPAGEARIPESCHGIYGDRGDYSPVVVGSHALRFKNRDILL